MAKWSYKIIETSINVNEVVVRYDIVDSENDFKLARQMTIQSAEGKDRDQALQELDNAVQEEIVKLDRASALAESLQDSKNVTMVATRVSDQK